MPTINGTYSFLDVYCDISGPGGSFMLSGSGNTKEGITVAMLEDKASMVIGADGTPMHSLHAGKGGTLTVRLLKTSPTNALLSDMYTFQTQSAAYHGQNYITVRNPIRGDSITASQCGFRKLPDNVNAEEGGMMEWVFNGGIVDQKLGAGFAGA